MGFFPIIQFCSTMLFDTILPAAIIVPSVIVTPFIIIERQPIHTLSPIKIDLGGI